MHRHTSRRLLQKVQKADALPGSPQLPRAREGPRTAQPQTDWLQQQVPRGPPQLRQDLVKGHSEGGLIQPAQLSTFRGASKPRVGAGRGLPCSGGCVGLDPKIWGPFPGPPLPTDPRGDTGTPGSVCLTLFQRHPLAKRCSLLWGDWEVSTATSDLISCPRDSTVVGGRRNTATNTRVGPGQTPLSPVC